MFLQLKITHSGQTTAEVQKLPPRPWWWSAARPACWWPSSRLPCLCRSRWGRPRRSWFGTRSARQQSRWNEGSVEQKKRGWGRDILISVNFSLLAPVTAPRLNFDKGADSLCKRCKQRAFHYAHALRPRHCTPATAPPEQQGSSIVFGPRWNGGGAAH